MKNEQSKIESRTPKGEGVTLNAYMYVQGGGVTKSVIR